MMDRRCERTCRNVYIDAGASWCNTLRLHAALPGPQNATLAAQRRLYGIHHQPTHYASSPWLVIGFEASPIISNYAARCAEALSAGKPRPPLAVPASSSTADLYKAALALDNASCSMAGQARLECAMRLLKPKLRSLGASPRLELDALHSRMDSAGRSCPLGRDQYTMVPAAVGDHNGMVELLAGSNNEQLVKGGLMLPGGSAAARQQRHLRKQSVPLVDLVGFIRRSFTVADFVLLKLDVEGAEQMIVPALAQATGDNGTPAGVLIDIIVWECHVGGRRPCHELLEQLKAAGVGAIYTEPRSWSWARQLCTAPFWRRPDLRRLVNDAPERRHECRNRSWWRRHSSRGIV